MGLTGKVQLEQELSNQGAKVIIECCDVSSLVDVENFAKKAMSEFPPIKGIIHGPMVLRDRNLHHMTLDDFRVAISPKYHGSRNLIDVFRSTRLDWSAPM